MNIKKNKIIKIVLIVLLVIVVWKLVVRYRGETYASYEPRSGNWETLPADRSPWSAEEKALTPTPGDVTAKPVPGWTGAPPAVDTDLLPQPKQVQTDYSEFAPKGELIEQNLIDASKLVMVDTVGSSLKNANYSLRRDPVIERQDIGPWQNTTITADLLRKPLEEE